MSFQSTINLLNSLIILLSFIHFISTEVEIRDPVNNRDLVIHEIDDRRSRIQYVVQVLNRLDRSLENLKYQNLQKRDCIGIPGTDCGVVDQIKLPPRGPNFKRDIRQLLRKKRDFCLPGSSCEGDVIDPGRLPVKIPTRTPNFKRKVRQTSMSCQLFGVSCHQNPNQIKRKKREISFNYEDDDDDGRRSKCLSDEPAADCENNSMKEEASAQEWLKQGQGHRNPGKKSDETIDKRAFDCSPIGGLPGADCEWNEMGVEAKAQKIMKNSIRNPGRKRRSLLKLTQRMR